MRLYLFPVLGILTSSVLAQPMGHWDDEFPLGINGSQTPPISPEHMIHVFDGQQGRIVLLAEETIQVPHPNFCPDLSFPPGTFHYRSRTYLWTPPAPGGEPGEFQDVRICRAWVTCSGHSALPDGRVLIVGGTGQAGNGAAGANGAAGVPLNTPAAGPAGPNGTVC
jgi:hypothetical protein